MELKVIQNRKTYYIFSTILILISLGFLFFAKLNLGIDMTGGTSSEYSYSGELNTVKATELLQKESKKITFENKQIINDVSAYKITGENKITVVIGYDSSIETKKLEELKTIFRGQILNTLKTINPSSLETSYTNIGKSFGDYIKNTAFLTLGIAIVVIAIYLAWAFSSIATGISTSSFSFIVIAILFHDVIVPAGLYVGIGLYFREFKVDTFFITALLTILGYSINDTIVVFDRIRENIKLLIKTKTLPEIIDLSINETLRRSIFTSMTVFLTLIAILIWGPDALSGFILVMIFGVLVGTYSSIFIAAPLLYDMNKNKKITEYKEKQYNPEDKIVV